MAGTIKGIIVEIGGDTSGLQKALGKVNSATSSLTKELRGINSLLKLDPSNTELLSQKQKVLAENIEQTSKKLEELRKIQEMANSDMSKVSPENYRNLQREIVNTENKLKDLQVQASKWTSAGNSLEEFGNKVTNISSKIDNLGSTLTKSLTLPVLAIGTAAVTTGNDFEAQMSRVQAIAGATKDELEQLTNQAIELGAKTSFSASEVAAGMENLASAGFTTNEIMEAMPGLLNLAASSGAELATASEIAASAIRGFGLEANESAHVADIFAEASARTNAQVEDMGEAMKYIAPVANTMGLEIEEVAAAIGIMSDAGIKGSQAGTSLRGALVRLTKPTDKMLGVMEDLGISFYDNEGKMKSLTEMISMLQEATKGLTDEQKQNALTILFGTESLSGMMSLINRGSKDLADMTKSFEDCDGAAQNMADTMLDNAKGSIESLKGSLESAGIAIQKALAPEIKDLAKWIQDLVDDFNELSDEEKQNIVNTALLVAAIGPAIKVLGKLGQGIGTATKALGTFSKAIIVAKTGATTTDKTIASLANKIGFLTTPTGLATTAIVALTAAVAANYAANVKEKASLGGLREEVIKQSDSWRELQETRNDTLSSSLPEIETTQKLADELRKITDENGKVKSGYEQRAQVILGQLNTALGTEYKLNGNIISQYKELKENIDKVIATKKAEAVLTAYEEEYNEAMKKQTEATETLVGLKQKLAEATEKMTTGNMRERKEAEIQYSSIAQQIGEQTRLVGEYGKTITDYDNLRAASISGNEKQIEEATKNMMTSYEQIKQKSDQTIEQQVISQGEYIKVLNESLTEAKRANDEYQAGILDSQLQTEQQKLANLVDSLVKQTTTVEELTPEQILAWKTLAENSYTEYANALGKVGPTTSQKIQEATGIVVNDASLELAAGQKATNANMLFGQNLKLADSTNTQITNSADALKNDTTVQDEAKKVAERAGEEIEKVNSKSWGEQLIEDLGKGMDGKARSPWFSGILSGIGSLISSRLSSSGSTSNKTNQLPGHKNGLDYVPYDDYIARLHKGERVLTAKENKLLMSTQKLTKSGKIDFKNLANNVTNKNNFYFNLQINPKSLTESDMRKCFDFLEKEAGKYI